MFTVINFLKRFAYDLFHAVFFAAIEYDDRLKMTKTTQERVFIWLGIGIVTAIGIYALLYGFWYFLDSIDTSQIEKE